MSPREKLTDIKDIKKTYTKEVIDFLNKGAQNYLNLPEYVL